MSDPKYLDDPKAEKAFFEGIAWAFGISEQKAREIFKDTVAEEEKEKGQLNG